MKHLIGLVLLLILLKQSEIDILNKINLKQRITWNEKKEAVKVLDKIYRKTWIMRYQGRQSNIVNYLAKQYQNYLIK